MTDLNNLIRATSDFAEAMALRKRSEIANIRRFHANTQEAFKTLRQQIDIFEKRILEDYAAMLLNAEDNLSEIEGRNEIEQAPAKPAINAPKPKLVP